MADPSDHLATADVWTILDLIVAEWKSDPQSCTCFDLRVIHRATVLSEARRKQTEVEQKDAAFAVFTQAFADYLETIGWRVLVAGAPRILGFETPGIGKYQFAIDFTGGRKREEPKLPDIIVPGNGGLH